MSSSLKHSLEGRLPQQDSPVCVEISMENLEVRTYNNGYSERTTHQWPGDSLFRWLCNALVAFL